MKRGSFHKKEKYYVGRSAIDGKGMFAGRNFKRGEIIAFIKGKPIRFLVRNPKDSRVGPNWIGVGRNLWMDVKSPFKFLNHSCDPNTSIKGKVTLVALRNIKKGEELTLDYSLTEEDMWWNIRCTCGAKKCRKVVRSIQFLPETQYHSYYPFIPTYFQKIYQQARGGKLHAS